MARPPSFDRQEVLRAAERQFRRTGYAGTSVDDIAAATGLGRGSLYAAFGDKHSLFLQTLGGYCDRFAAELSAALTGPDEQALDRLRDYLVGSVGLVTDDDQLGCMAGRFAVEMCGQDVQAAERISAGHARLQQALAGCVEAAQRHGDLDPTVDPHEIACLLLTIARGIDVVAKSGTDPARLTAVAERAIACLPRARRPAPTAP